MQRSIVLRTTPALAALVLATATTAASAQAPATPATPPSPSTSAAAMNFQQVIERVTALGYNDVREVERKGDKLYEIEARNAQSRKVELTLDARSGEVLREEVKR
jgi:hypothetical protein